MRTVMKKSFILMLSLVLATFINTAFALSPGDIIEKQQVYAYKVRLDAQVNEEGELSGKYNMMYVYPEDDDGEGKVLLPENVVIYKKDLTAESGYKEISYDQLRLPATLKIKVKVLNKIRLSAMEITVVKEHSGATARWATVDETSHK